MRVKDCGNQTVGGIPADEGGIKHCPLQSKLIHIQIHTRTHPPTHARRSCSTRADECMRVQRANVDDDYDGDDIDDGGGGGCSNSGGGGGGRCTYTAP